MSDPTDATIAAYERGVSAYLAHSSPPASGLAAFLDRFASRVDSGPVLEIGSGPGWDALHLEALGVTVERTDATRAFVDRLRAEGHPARVLDVRTDDLGGPYRGVLADAVLLHLDRAAFGAALVRLRDAAPDGILAITLKEGDGEEWSDAKLGEARYFCYWREDELRATLATSGWRVIELDHVAGARELWLFVLAG